MDGTNFGGLMLLIIAAILAILLLLWAALRPSNSNNISAPKIDRRWGQKSMAGDDIDIAPHRLERLRQVHDQCKPARASYNKDHHPSAE